MTKPIWQKQKGKMPVYIGRTPHVTLRLWNPERFPNPPRWRYRCSSKNLHGHILTGYKQTAHETMEWLAKRASVYERELIDAWMAERPDLVEP